MVFIPFRYFLSQQYKCSRAINQPQNNVDKIKSSLYSSNNPIKSSYIKRNHMASRNHGNKVVKELFRQLSALGFVIEHKGSTGYKITPPPSIHGPVYYTHGTPQAVKPILNQFRKIYGVSLHDPAKPPKSKAKQ